MKTRDNAKIIELRQAAYAAQLETVENYLANSVWLPEESDRGKEEQKMDGIACRPTTTAAP